MVRLSHWSVTSRGHHSSNEKFNKEYINKNLDRGFKDLSFFEIGPIYKGDNPNEQISTITGIRYGDRIKKDWKKEAVKFWLAVGIKNMG